LSASLTYNREGVTILAQEEKDHKQIIGDRLELLREKRKPGYSKKDVADELNLSPSTYNDWSGGRRGPDGGKLVLLAKYFNTTVDYITGLTDDDSPIDKEQVSLLLKDVQDLVNIDDAEKFTPEQVKVFQEKLNKILKNNSEFFTK
jgi:transcriptional regulator with XRE-family HTH domain